MPSMQIKRSELRLSALSLQGRAILIVGVLLFGSAVGAAAADFSDDIPLAGGRLLGQGPDRLLLGAGAFNVIPNDDDSVVDNNGTSVEWRAEYKVGTKWYGLAPLVGIMGNSDGGVYGYAALYSELAYGDFIFTPAAGLGGYARNGSKDLGGVFQFQISLEAAYAFTHGSRLGLRLSHISNAQIHDINPGQESALVIYSVPLN